MVKHCTKVAAGLAEEQPESNRMVHSFVKATDISSPEKLFEEIAKMLGKKVSSDKSILEKALSVGKQKGPIVLVLDEFDFLWKPKTKNSQKGESILDTVLRWAADPQIRLAVIGISNSVGDESAKSIHSSTQVSRINSRSSVICCC